MTMVMDDRSQSYTRALTSLSENDVPAIARLYARCDDYFFIQDGEAATLLDARELFTDVPPEKSENDQTVLAWRESQDLDALASMLRDYPSTGIWYLGFMLVDPDLRGQGVGRLFYSMLERWAINRGAKEIRLAVVEANHQGYNFWISLGFHEIRRVGPDDFKGKTHWRIELSRDLHGGLP
jgi:GNAT superfamily N-acetyltransferase